MALSAEQARPELGSEHLGPTRPHRPDHLDDNPSMKPLLPHALASAYRIAWREAVAETGLAVSTFPETGPWTVVQVLDQGFRPE
jgi:hypothetical protein